jgi:hypothetical protein
MTTPLKTGARLRSQVCATEVIVVRPASGDVTLTCGGVPMIDIKEQPAGGVALDPALATGTLLGKRYTLADDATFEVLVTKAGDGTLANGTTPLVVKEAKPLPASD